jgi:hypothetical protein
MPSGAIPSNRGFDTRMLLEINKANLAVPLGKTRHRSVPMENTRGVMDHPPSRMMTVL